VGLSQSYVDKTVYQYLVDNGYSSFITLLKETRQDGLLQGDGPVTVFAPSNAAVAKMDPDVMSTMAHNTWQKNNLIKYHLVSDFLLIPEMTNDKYIMTMAGEKIELLHIGHSLILNNHTHVDFPPNNDIVCTNGIIHPIDSVLIPPFYSTDNLVAILIERDELFQEFLMSVMLTNLTTMLESGEYTIFAPINYAYLQFLSFMRPGGAGGGPVNATAQQIGQHIGIESTKYHVVPGARSYDMLKNGEKLFTLHGEVLNITDIGLGKMVNQAKIVQRDIAASNGIIHAIDDTLFPRDLLHLMSPEYRKYFESKLDNPY